MTTAPPVTVVVPCGVVINVVGAERGDVAFRDRAAYIAPSGATSERGNFALPVSIEHEALAAEASCSCAAISRATDAQDTSPRLGAGQKIIVGCLGKHANMRFIAAIEKFALPSARTAKICPLSPVATKESASAPKRDPKCISISGQRRRFFSPDADNAVHLASGDVHIKRAFESKAIACATRSVDSKNDAGLACRAAFQSGRPLQGRRRHKAHPSNRRAETRDRMRPHRR